MSTPGPARAVTSVVACSLLALSTAVGGAAVAFGAPATHPHVVAVRPLADGDLNDPPEKEIAMELVSSAENSTLDWKAEYSYAERQPRPEPTAAPVGLRPALRHRRVVNSQKGFS